MSAIETNCESLERLGVGDYVRVAELAKRSTLALCEILDTPSVESAPSAEIVERLLGRSSPFSEDLLAAFLPLIEYGGERGLEVIPRCLLLIAGKTAAVRHETTPHYLGGALVVGRLVWSISSYAVHCGRLDALAEAGRAIVRVPHTDNHVEPLISLKALRYPDAFGRRAGAAWDNYHDWLVNLDLVNLRYPLLVADFEAVFAEADLLLAMRTALEQGGVYSAGKDIDTARRFAIRARDEKYRTSLAALFNTDTSSLDGVLESAYATITTDPERWLPPPTTLFGAYPD